VDAEQIVLADAKDSVQKGEIAAVYLDRGVLLQVAQELADAASKNFE
jgi:hypothetical protein